MMDRDPSENTVDPVERDTPSTGQNDTGDVGDQASWRSARRKGPSPSKPISRSKQSERRIFDGPAAFE